MSHSLTEDLMVNIYILNLKLLSQNYHQTIQDYTKIKLKSKEAEVRGKILPTLKP